MMASDFVKDSLGFWSSHPESLKKQRMVFLLLGFLPIIVAVVFCVLVYEDLFAWNDFLAQIGVLTYAVFFSLGFLVTLCVLYMACFAIGRKKGAFTNKDELVFPLWWLPVGFLVFWLLVYGLSVLPEMPLLKKLAERYPSLPFLKFDFGPKLGNVKALLCLLAGSPFLCVLTWILCSGVEKPRENEKLVRRPLLLWAALGCVGLLCASFFIPKYRLAIWILMLPLSLIFFTLWWFWRKKVVQEGKQAAVPEEEEKAAEEEDEIPEQARYIIEALEGRKGIRYEAGGRQSLTSFSPHVKEDGGSSPLIALMNGLSPAADQKRLIPTVDQKEFLDKFRDLYEEALADFLEENKTQPALPDIILHGPEGSGRTEALCAAAVYAAVVRGQNVLYIVQDDSYARSLAEKIKARLHDLWVDSYYTADCLGTSFVGDWIPQENSDEPRQLAPNILFAVPEQVERALFRNSNLISPKQLEERRRLLLSYSVILVDDFLEMPLTLQAHLAFILDKFRLLQASEYVTGQFVIATAPLNEYGVDDLGKRLFPRFSEENNAVRLRPRPCDPFWCGTLRVSPAEFGGEERVLENAADFLLGLCIGKYSALFYSKEIGRDEAKKLEADYKKKGGVVSVSSRLYELDVKKMPFDTIFYLSLTSGNAAAALRLSMPDGKAGVPVFFRIALENEPEKTAMEGQFALLPDETAFPLSVYHLRSVLQFLPPLTPISDVVWSHFGISLKHKFLRDARINVMPEGTVPVKWLCDSYPEAPIWPFFVLDSQTAISNAEQVDFALLPNTQEGIWRGQSDSGSKGEALYLCSGEGLSKISGGSSQVADWLDEKGVSVGRTDLAHSDRLELVTGEGNHYSFGTFLEPEKSEEECAVVIEKKTRRGLSRDIPVRRFSWELPEGGFSLLEEEDSEGCAWFFLRFGESFTDLVSAEICGLMNSLARSSSCRPPRQYAYAAFMSCLVFLPDTDRKGENVCKCLTGKWSTEASGGFSAPLTHAFSIALRNRMGAVSFFAMTPVFLLGERDGAFGRLLVWLLEPNNSGRVVFPLLTRTLFRDDPAFKAALLADIEKILVRDNGEYVDVEELRRLSQMAFAEEEKLTREQWTSEIKRGLDVIRQLLRDSGYPEDDEGGLEDELKTLEEERRKRFEEYIDFSGRTEEERRQFKEFTAQVTADLMDFKDAVDLTRFCTEYGWSEEKVKENFFDVLWNSPEIFFVAKSFCCEVERTPEGTIVSCILRELIYGIRKEEFADAKARLERAAAEAMKSLAGVADPVKKALKLHDYIIDICDYDEEARDKKDPTPLARTAYSVLVRHRAVCEGYTMAYRYLLNLAGIKSEEVNSNDMNHCWNYVNLDGHWYHVDVTWDDPVYRGGKPKNAGISHEYFLLSDEKIRSREHHDWSVRGLPPASDTKYDDMDWNS